MEVRNVERIPERKFPFVLSEQTKKWIDFLNDLPVSKTIEVAVSEDYDHAERERRLRVIRDRLKSATKRANGVFEYCRRNNAYYVKRLTEQEKIIPNNLKNIPNNSNSGFRDVSILGETQTHGITQKTREEKEEDKGYYEEREEYL